MTNLVTWTSRPDTRPASLSGRHVTLTAYESRDAENLWNCFGGPSFNELAKYFPNPRYETVAPFRAWLDGIQRDFHTMVYRRAGTGETCGMATLMRTDRANGVTEVGSICHSRSIQRSPVSTEAQYLLARHVFDDLGYRRYEWKLDNENRPSHDAAVRFGFRFEGIFRNHMVVKGKNRDTAWYAMTDADWPICKAAFSAWLAPENFDVQGKQRRRLEDIRAEMRARPAAG